MRTCDECGGTFGGHWPHCSCLIKDAHMKRSTTEDYPQFDPSCLPNLQRDIEAARGVKPYEAMADDPVGGTVNHPKHYNEHPSGVECIDVIEHMPFNIGNAVKYLWRAGLKGDAIEDLKKACWYVEREIKKRTK